MWYTDLHIVVHNVQRMQIDFKIITVKSVASARAEHPAVQTLQFYSFFFLPPSKTLVIIFPHFSAQWDTKCFQTVWGKIIITEQHPDGEKNKYTQTNKKKNKQAIMLFQPAEMCVVFAAWGDNLQMK